MHKKKKSLFLVFIIIVLIVLVFFGALYYITSTVNNYSYNEKKWINDNLSTSLDIYVEPGLPVFSYNGKGVYHDYISALKEDTHLNLNVISDDTAGIRFVNKNNLTEDDIVFYKDHFVVLGRSGNISKLDDLENKRVGVLTSDKENVSYYLTEHKNINLVAFESYTDLVASLNRATDYVIAPMYKYLDKIVATDSYDILYHLDGLYSYYCISFKEDANESLKGVMTKFY